MTVKAGRTAQMLRQDRIQRWGGGISCCCIRCDHQSPSAKCWIGGLVHLSNNKTLHSALYEQRRSTRPQPRRSFTICSNHVFIALVNKNLQYKKISPFVHVHKVKRWFSNSGASLEIDFKNHPRGGHCVSPTSLLFI